MRTLATKSMRHFEVLGCLALLVASAAWSQAPRRLPDARVGQPFVYTVHVQGLIEPLGFEWNTGDAGWIAPEGPTLRGTPLTVPAEPHRISVAVTDALGKTLTSDFLLAVRPEITALRMATSALPVFVQGVEAQFDLAASGGEGAYTWAAEGESLPEGLRIVLGQAGEVCQLAGTPATPGDFELRVTVSDAFNSVGPVALHGRVLSAPPELTIDGAPLAAARYRSVYTGQFVAVGGYPPYTWHIQWANGPVPDWMDFDPQCGSISGMPTRVETRRFDLQVSDSAGHTAHRSDLVLEVVAPESSEKLRVVPAQLAAAKVGEAYSATLHAVGLQGLPQWTLSRTHLPAWAEVVPEEGALAIRGVPETSGTWTFEVTLRDTDSEKTGNTGDGYTFGSFGPQSYAIAAVEPPGPFHFLTERLPVAVVSVPYSVQLAACGGDSPFRFRSDTSVAPWLELSTEGILSGTAVAPQKVRLNIEAVDSQGGVLASKTYELAVFDRATPPLTLPEVGGLATVAGEEIRFQLPVAGGTPPYTFQWVGVAPAGLEIDSDGIVTGSPEFPGEFEAAIDVQDASANKQQSQTRLALRVLPAAKPGPAAVWSWRSALWLAAGLALGFLLAASVMTSRNARQVTPQPAAAAATIERPCPHCGHSLRISAQYLGRKIRCRYCNGEFRIEKP